MREVIECRIESDDKDIFIVADGVRIARRGYPGTPQAGTWVSIEPGWSVRDCASPDENDEEGPVIEIEYKKARVH